MDSHCGRTCLSNALRIRDFRVRIMPTEECGKCFFKNVFIISIGVITYAFFGFNTHYPGDFNGWFSWGGMIGDLNADAEIRGYGGLGLAMTGFGDFIFQAMFAATGATIVSGAVASVSNSVLYDFRSLFVGVAYPVAGSW